MRMLNVPIRRARRRGFTLIEAAMVTVLVGVGVIATLELLASGTMANTSSTELTTAMHLAGNVREAQLREPYPSLFSTFDNKTFSPPIDGTRKADGSFNTIANMPGWAQTVDVQSVDPNWITLVIPDNPTNKTSRVNVTVTRNGQVVYRTNWLAASPE